MRKLILAVLMLLAFSDLSVAQLCGTNGVPNEYTVCRSTPEWGGLPVGLPVTGLNGGITYLPGWYDDPSIVNREEIGGCNGVGDPNCLGRVELLGWPYWSKFTPTESWCEHQSGQSSEYDCWAYAIRPVVGYIGSNGVFRYNGEFGFTAPAPNSGETSSVHIAGWIDVSDSQFGMYDYMLLLRPYFTYTYNVEIYDPFTGENEFLLSSERVYFNDNDVVGSFQWLAVERFYSNVYPKGKHERWYFEGFIEVPDYFTPPSCSGNPNCLGTEFISISNIGMEWSGEYRHKFSRANGVISWIMRGYVEEDQVVQAIPPCPVADLNCDGSVNGMDIAVITRSNSRTFSKNIDLSSDLNKDGLVNGLDIAVIVKSESWLQQANPCICSR